MKTKSLWLIWLYIFAFCCVLGFIPNPPVAVQVLFILMGIGFFVPGTLLLVMGDDRSVRLVRMLSILSLALTLTTIILNFASALMKPLWGTVFYIIMGILSTPMLCCQIWAISLFGWACLLAGSFFRKK